MHVEVGGWSDRPYPQGAVVVGYNGKKHSSVALAWGAREAERRGAPLLVLYAANYPGMVMEPGPGLLEREPGALDAARSVTTRGVVEASAAHPQLHVVGATEVTSPSRALTQAGAGAAMVVLGSRSYGRVVRTLLGSVAFAVAAQADCPVVVVKDETVDRPVGPSHPVVVGTDGSPAAVAALDFAAAFAAATSSPMEVLTCTREHDDGVDEAELWASELRASAERIAASAADHAQTLHPTLTVTWRVEEGPAEVALIGASATAGLVVVGTRGRGAFEGMLLGSVSHAVIHDASCTVAVVGSTIVETSTAASSSLNPMPTST